MGQTNSATVIAILDDDAERVAEMQRALTGLVGGCDVQTFDNAPDVIEWLKADLARCSLISLDHDLGPSREIGGERVDPGTGRDVADYLAAREPVCPIVIHTSNSMAGTGMRMALEEGKWVVARVYPYSDTAWIAQAWITEVARSLSRSS